MLQRFQEMIHHCTQLVTNMAKKHGPSPILALMSNLGPQHSDKALNSQLLDSDLITELSLQLALKILIHL